MYVSAHLCMFLRTCVCFYDPQELEQLEAKLRKGRDEPSAAIVQFS